MEWQSFAQWAAPFVATFIGWAIKHWVYDIFKERNTQVDARLSGLEQSVGAIRTSLDKPNGGSSVRDALNRIEVGQAKMISDLAHLKGRFDNHIEESRE